MGSYQELVDSHGQATVERGFSTNKQVSVDNLQECSFVALRQISDYIKTVNGSLNVKITKSMISSVATARQKYMSYLDKEKKRKEKEVITMKRKSVMEELDDLKAKKKKLECEAEGLAKSADCYSLKAEKEKNIKEVRHLGGKVKQPQVNIKAEAKETNMSRQDIIWLKFVQYCHNPLLAGVVKWPSMESLRQ